MPAPPITSPPSFWELLTGQTPAAVKTGQPLADLPDPEARMSLLEHLRADPLGAIMQGGLGLLGVGGGTTRANQVGQVLGAAAPLVGSTKALVAAHAAPAREAESVLPAVTDWL